jgi:hypothetical protein
MKIVRMGFPRKGIALAAGLAFAAITGHALADTLEAMQGAWAMDGTDCAAIFKNDGGTIKFQEGDTSEKTGIIISGDKITGPASVCTAGRIRQEDGRLVARLSCEDAIMAGGMSVAFKIIDADHFETFDHFYPDDSTSYARCPM